MQILNLSKTIILFLPTFGTVGHYKLNQIQSGKFDFSPVVQVKGQLIFLALFYSVCHFKHAIYYKMLRPHMPNLVLNNNTACSE